MIPDHRPSPRLRSAGKFPWFALGELLGWGLGLSLAAAVHGVWPLLGSLGAIAWGWWRRRDRWWQLTLVSLALATVISGL